LKVWDKKCSLFITIGILMMMIPTTISDKIDFCKCKLKKKHIFKLDFFSSNVVQNSYNI